MIETSSTNIENEMWEILRAALPPKKRNRLTPASHLRDVGIDSLTLMVVVGKFVEKHPVQLDTFTNELAQVKTVQDLIKVGTMAASKV